MQYADLGKSPIAVTTPTGADVGGEPLYDELSAEIKKLSSPTAVGGIDWQAIERIACDILATKSKHILVACCLAIARQHNAGWHGFAEGAIVLRDLLTIYWDSCFPVKKRMRGRINAISWWQEMTDGLINSSEGEQWGKEERAALLTTLEEIDRFLGDQMEDAPVLRPTIQALGGHITEIETEEPQQDPPPQATTDTTRPETRAQPETRPSTPAPATRPKAPPASSEELSPEKNLARGCEYLRLVATQLLQNDPCHPLAFRLNRIIAWFPLDTLPPATDGATMLPPPDGQLISGLHNLAAAGNWTGLLQAAEQQVRQYLFWLDLHRFVATALERLGRDLAREGVTCEILLLLKRLPGLEKLSFSDGTPFADPATRDWLKELQAGGQRTGNQAAVTQEAGESLEKQVAKAQALATDNKLGEALQVLHQGLQTAQGGRSRLLWSLAICRLICRSRQPLIAIPLAATLMEQLDRHALEQWEPILAEDILVMVHQVVRLQEKNEQNQEQLRTVLGRLAVLNPARALEIL
jgi:type VI secretion system protein VasJ